MGMWAPGCVSALVARADDEVRCAVERELDEARYDVSLAARRYDAVDPTKRLVARELEARWNAALERVAELEARIRRLQAGASARPALDRAALMALAHDLPAAWNAPSATARTKQRIVRILVQEVVIDLDDAANEAVVMVHWHGGRHTEIHVARVSRGRYPDAQHPSAVEVIRKLGTQWPDRELAVTMNRMRCKSVDGESWTTVRVRELRERLGIAAFDPATLRVETISVDETAHHALLVKTKSVRKTALSLQVGAADAYDSAGIQQVLWPLLSSPIGQASRTCPTSGLTRHVCHAGLPR